MIRVLQWRIGLSGDGVTRSVLNACRELPAEEFENVYITGEQDTGACARLIGGDARVLSLPVSPLFHPLRFRRAADLRWRRRIVIYCISSVVFFDHLSASSGQTPGECAWCSTPTAPRWTSSVR